MPDDTSAMLRPFDARMLNVGDGHWIYVEEVGRRGGRPVLFLHGGPGSGSQPLQRTLFNPSRDHAFLFDQRGAGRSHPYLSLGANTTQHLVADIEALREHFGIEQWLVVGGSWGSTLAVAYAEAHPGRVSGLVLRAVFLGTDEEIAWAFHDGPRKFRPEAFAAWRDLLPDAERADPVQAYVQRLLNPDPEVHRPAAHAWSAYERTLSELTPGPVEIPARVGSETRLPPTPIVEAHYIAHSFFLQPQQLLREAGRLKGIPGAILQGRYDLLCPPVTAQALAEAWPNAALTYFDTAGHAMTERGIMDGLRAAITALQA